MIRVCHITSAHPSEDVRIFKKECISLAENGFKVFLVQPGIKNYEKRGVNIVGFGNKKNNRFLRILCSAYKAYKLARHINADIYHIHDPELLPYAYLLQLKGKKVIFDSHEYYYLQIKNKKYIPNIIRNVVSWLYYRIETYICKRISGVVSAGTFNGKEWFKNRSKIEVIVYNYPVLSDFYPDNKSIKEDYFCYIGSLSNDRGITNITKASYECKTKMVLAGSFSSTEYKDFILNMKEFQYVNYLGNIEQDDVRNIINKAFCGVSILRNVGQYKDMDNFPLKVLEYLACGIPVIMNNNKFNVNFLKKHNIGIAVEPDNINEIKNAIMYLKNNPKEAQEMGKIGYELVNKELNWDNQVAKLIAMYNDL